MTTVEEDRANALLIAASPEIYDALDRLVSFLGQKRVRLANKDLVLGEAREALAKAVPK